VETTTNNKGTVLVIEDDAKVANLMARALNPSFRVEVAAGALEGLSILESEPVDLILLDIGLPGITGLDLCKRVKSDVLLRHTPIIFVSGRDRTEDKVEGLHVGADDYLAKPFRLEELVARAEAAIRKSNLSLEANPLTRLPGNGSIERDIIKRIASRETFSVLYCDLNDFKAYNDYYGFIRGDQVIRETARVLLQSSEQGRNLVAHVGGDDFVIVTATSDVDGMCRDVLRRFDETAPLFYDERDRQAGFIVTKDRRGETHRFPLLSLSIGVVTNAVRPIKSLGEVAAIGAEVKGVAKRQGGSAYFIDKRRDPYAAPQKGTSWSNLTDHAGSRGEHGSGPEARGLRDKS
jgi:CheY-like chemotaxis protein